MSSLGDDEESRASATSAEVRLQEQIAELQASIAAAEQRAQAAEAARNQAQANATAARTAAAAVGARVPAPVVFAIAPAQLIQGNNLIDYSDKKGQALFEASTKPFGQIFDGDSKNLAAFKAQILDRATTAGWNVPGANILLVSDSSGNFRNIVTEYPLLSEEEIKTWATTNIVGQQTRLAQNNFSFYTALAVSIDISFKSSKLAHNAKSYTIQGVKIAALFLKKIFNETEVGSAAKIAFLRGELQNLPVMFRDLDYNVEDFNDKVESTLELLQAHGQTAPDLPTSLFRAYETARDEEFAKAVRVRYMSIYTEGEKEMTAEEILTFAKRKYQLYIQEGSWGSHVGAKDEILALKAEIKELKATAPGKGGKKKNENEKNKNKNKKKKDDNKAGYKNWQFKAPDAGKPTTKNVDGKEYHWCTKGHGKDNKPMWARHKPEDHGNQNRNVTSNTANANATSPSTAATTMNPPQASVEAALTSFIDE